MRSRLALGLAAFVLGAPSVSARECRGGADASAAAQRAELSVRGAVKRPLALKAADLRRFKTVVIGRLPLVCRTGAEVGVLSGVRGVLLRDVLDEAAVDSKTHDDVKKMVVIAAAADGYKAVFSWGEVFNSPIGDGIVVYFEDEGGPLKESEGPLALVSSKDVQTGPRHVKWLTSLEVRKIVD